MKSADFTFFLFVDIIKRVAAVGAECYAQNSLGREVLTAVWTFAPEAVENSINKKDQDEQDDADEPQRNLDGGVLKKEIQAEKYYTNTKRYTKIHFILIEVTHR